MRQQSRIYAYALLVLLSVPSAADTADQRRTAWVDPELAAFILQNAHRLRNEIRNGEGPRLESLLGQLRSRNEQVDLNCIQRIELAETNAYEFYLVLKDATSSCSG